MLLDIEIEMLGSIVEKLTIITVLALFLNYFMKELKTVQRLREADRKNCDEEMEKLSDRQFELEKQNVEAITRQNEINLRLIESINALCFKLEKYPKD